MLCFVLVLPSLPPHLLRDLKQSLLQLANLYAISGGGQLPDRLALCYLHWSRACGSLELKFAYIPRGNFCLRDFHHAVNNLPSDSYSPEPTEVGSVTKGPLATTISKLFNKDALYSWGSNDILRKVIYISSHLEGKIDDAKKTLVDAAEQCISLEFMLMEQELDQLVDTHERLKEFSNSISDLENCILRKCFPDIWVLYGLVKKWLHEVKDDGVDIHQAVFVFKNNLARSANQIFCKLLPSTCPIVDGFNPCKACRCHGLPLGNSRNSPPSCPVTNLVLECQHLVDNVISIGENTILFLPSFENFSMPRKISFPITFKIMTRTSLASLTEALFMGTSYFVAPSTYHEMEVALDEQDNSEMNCQIFHGLSRALHILDEGLVCSSHCNIDTMRETALQCFYLIQPSDKGLMLLRRMAGSEETLPLPNVIVDVQVPKDIEGSIQASLLEMESRDYSPLLNERGLHSKLNCLVKESLHFGSIPKSTLPEPSNPNPVAALLAVEVSDNDSEGDNATMEDSSASITQEWEQLIVHEVSGYSPTCIIKSVVDKAVQSTEVRPLDEKTSRILERLEVPKAQKVQCSSPANTNRLKIEICAPTKKPLVPFDGNRMKDSGSSLSQPMRPIFRKLKRKQR